MYWMFPDAELAYMWYPISAALRVKHWIHEISMLVQTDESFGYAS